MKRRRLIAQIFFSFAAVIAATVAVNVWYSNRTLHDVLIEQTRSQLRSAAEVAAPRVDSLLNAPNFRQAFAAWGGSVAAHTSLRLTVIRPDGTVVADSEEDPARMENHADRPEVKEALLGRPGERTGISPTLHKEMMYVAVPAYREARVIAVCRASAPVASLEAVGAGVRRRMAFAGILCVLLGALVSFWLSRHITIPIKEMQSVANRLAEGDFEASLRLPKTYELAALASSVNGMATQLSERLQAITRQKEEAEAILASMVEGVVAIDQDRTIIKLNAAAARILGLSLSTVVGRGIQEAIRNPGLYGIVTRTLATGEPTEADIVLHDEHGETHLQVHGSRLPHRGGAGQTGAVLVLNDVTRLRHLEVIRRDFAANVSQELRTPITSITGFVETLLDGALDNREDAERFLKIVHKHAERLNALISDLLSLAGIEKEAENGTILRSRIPLGPELRDAVAQRQAEADAKGMTVEIACPADLCADINDGLFEQAVVNLLDNAINYSPAGTSVEVNASRSGHEVRIRVSDAGQGIAPEHIDRLFERFYRVDKARRREDGGTGLGLAIVKHVVQAHKGHVEVESTPGKGSTFTLVLPDEVVSQENETCG